MTYRPRCKDPPRASSLPDDLRENPLPPPSVEFAVEDLLPGTEVELAGGDGHHHFAAHDLALHVRVGVIFAGAVVTVLRDRLVRGQFLQPVVVVLEEAVLRVVDVDAGGDMHGIDEAESFLHPAPADEIRDLVGDIQVIPPVRVKGSTLDSRRLMEPMVMTRWVLSNVEI